MKRWIALLLTICMILSMLPVIPMSAAADDAEQETAEQSADVTADAEAEEGPAAPAEEPSEEAEPAEEPSEEEVIIPDDPDEDEIAVEPEEGGDGEEPEEREDGEEPEEGEDGEEPEEGEDESEEDEEENPDEEIFHHDNVEDCTPDRELDADSLLNGYMHNPDGVPVYDSSNMLRGRLSAPERMLYDAAKTMITEVAKGQRSSAVLKVTTSSLGLPSTHYNASKLGLSTILDSNGDLTDAAEQKLLQAVGGFDIGKVWTSLLYDCPYEMYWADLRISVRDYGIWYSTSGEVWFDDCVEVWFYVSAEYSSTGQERTTTVNTTKINSVNTAINNAKNIVSKHAGKSDYEKLKAYQNELCALNTYNSAALASGVPYGNPWQIIYMFDGNSSTNVVCEGYAKSFAYLCELSSFSTGLKVYCVSGTAYFSNNYGPHMWNIVHMDNGLNYMVDVTNSDAGSYSNNTYFFTLPTSGSVSGGYYFGSNRFVYDSDTRSVYTTAELTLGSTAYSGAATSTGPQITKQPASVTVEVGGAAAFSLTATGTGLTYQWQIRTSSTGTWSPLTDATSYGISITAQEDFNGFQFRCVVKDSGGRSVTSNTATLTVTAAHSIVTQPSNQDVLGGKTATFTVAASGTGLKYQWQYSPDSGYSWYAVPSSFSGYNAAALKVTTTASMNGYLYRCLITDSAGHAMYTNNATLTVGTPVSIVTQPVSTSLKEASGNAVFSVTASGVGVTYRWQYKTPNGSWTDSSSNFVGYNDHAIAIPAVMSRNGYQYRCRLTDKYGSVAYSNAATLTVTPSVTVATQPQDQTVGEGKSASFAVKASGAACTYQWQYLIPGSGWLDCSSTTSGYNTNTLKPVGILARNGYQYRCVLTATATGTKVYSNAVTLTVMPGPKLSKPLPPQMRTDGETFTVAVEATGTKLSYQWQFRVSGGQWVACPYEGNTTSALKLTANSVTAQYQYRCVVTDTYGSTMETNAFDVLVLAKLAITAQPKSQSVGENLFAEFNVAASSSGLKYQWQYLVPDRDWANCTSATEGYNTHTLKPQATAARDGYQYRCVVTNGAGSKATTNPATLTVIPAVKITAQPQNQLVTVNQSAAITVAAVGTGLKYQWQWAGDSGWTDASESTAGYNTETLRPVGAMNRNGRRFRCIITDEFGNKVISKEAILSVKEGVKVTQNPSPVTTSDGMTVSFTVTADGEGMTYQWQYLIPGSAWQDCSSATVGYNTSTLKTEATEKRNNYKYRCVVTDVYGNVSTSGSAVLTVVAAPKITKQPANVTIVVNETAAIQVAATGTGVKYQWQWKSAISDTWSDSSSATVGYNTNTLKPVGAASRNGMQYRCVVTDAYGNKATSNAVTLTVNPGPTITTQPAAVTTSEGMTVTFTVAATGTDLKYQWQFQVPNGGWQDCSSATDGYNAAAVKPVAAASRNNYRYRCRITDAYGNVSTSNAAQLTVVAAPKITKQPANVTIVVNETAAIQVTATGTGVKYQWQWKSAISDTWSNSSSATVGYNTNTLKPVGAMSRNGMQYRCVVTDTYGNKATSNAVTLTVNPGPTITTQPAAVTTSEGMTATFTVAATGTDLKYQWQFLVPNGGWQNCSSATDGYNAAAVKPVAAASRNNYKYRCIVTDSYGNVTTSSSALFVVVAAPKITKQPADFATSEGMAASFSITAAGTGLKYQWQWSNNSGESWQNCSSATEGYNAAALKPAAELSRNNFQYRCVVTDTYGNKVTSNSVVFKVAAAPKITVQPVSKTYGEGKTASFSVTATGTGLKYQWQWSNNSGESWQNCSSATVGYNAASVKPVADMSRSGYSYRCIVTDAYGSKLTSNAAVLTVAAAPKITVQPTNQAVAVGSTAAFKVTATGTSLTYQWQWKSAISDTWSNSSSSTVGYNTNTLKPEATENRNGYQYRCVISDPYGNSVTSAAATLKLPTALKITQQPVSQSGEIGSAAVFTVVASGDGLKYQWQWQNAVSGWQNCSAATEGYNTASVKPVVTEARYGYQYRCVITDAYGETVTSNAATLSRLVPVKITQQPASQTVALNASAAFTVTAVGDGLKYQWQWQNAVSGWQNCSSTTAGYNTAKVQPVATTARNGYQYRCIITDVYGNRVTSNAAVMTVK